MPKYDLGGVFKFLLRVLKDLILIQFYRKSYIV